MGHCTRNSCYPELQRHVKVNMNASDQLLLDLREVRQLVWHISEVKSIVVRVEERFAFLVVTVEIAASVADPISKAKVVPSLLHTEVNEGEDRS